jgi:gliding motility-associated-like protein
MKKHLSSFSGWLSAVALLLISDFSFAQTSQQLTKEQWEAAKLQHQLDGKAPATFLTNDSSHVVARISPNVPVHPASNTCSCWQQRDASFSVVPFSGYIGPDYRNDDGFTNSIPIPFNFCLYGTTWNSLFVNNNGNVSFGASYSTFTAQGFPNASFIMVAPFWGDVDTRNPASGLVYYKITPTYMIVQWDSVGYYGNHADLRNTFQLIITDGSDPIVPNGNVSFCYKDMQWTTGDASSGVGGFGGFDAIVGANKGDGVNYIQFGSFNQPGSVYNGPLGVNSGIDWLDNQSFTFDACTNSNNIPPTPSGFNACDTFRICQNDTLPLNVQFFSPEANQNTVITVNSIGVNGYTIVSNTPGNTAQLISYLLGQANNIGYNTITITATDNGSPAATTVITIVIEVTASPTTSAVSTPTTCSANNGTATVTATGGSGTYSYSWNPSGQTTATATGLGSGTYTCTVTDLVSGCASTQTVVVPNTGNLTVTSTQNNVSCFGGTGDATVTPNGGQGPYTYSWSPSGGTAATATGLAAGSYTCTITDANGCIVTQVITITQPAGMTIAMTTTNVLCNGQANGSASSIVSGGAPSYTYAWAPSGGNGSSASNLNAGTYTFAVTDANGCTQTQLATITEPAVLFDSVSVVPVGCFATGSATAWTSGGTGPYTYLWQDFSTSSTDNNLTAGTYTVQITDANGCTYVDTAVITSVNPIVSTQTVNNITCFGAGNGSATVTPSGGTAPYTYFWSPSGGNNATATGLSSGTYTCTITDANGCTGTATVTVIEPSLLTSTSSSSNVSCNGGADGTGTVTPAGGTPGYTYAWAPSGSGSTAQGLTAGSYTITVSDANGCVTTQTITITQPTVLNVNMVGDSACVGSVSTISATGSGGSAPYTYAWSNGPTTASQNVILNTTTNYTVTVTDANGCQTTGTTLVSVNPLPIASITTNAVNGVYTVDPSQQLCFFGPSNGISAWSWLLQPGTSNLQSPCVNITAADTGTYCAQLIVQNIHGCLDTANVCVEINNVSYSIPNVYTPNGDGNNDVFIITNTGMKSLHCIIYDRWGVLIYEWDSPTGYWDGRTKSGKEAVDGVYYWTVDMMDYSGKEYADHGFVHLIRGGK